MDLREQLKAKLAELKALQVANPEGMSEEVLQKAQALMGEAKSIQAQIELANETKAATDYLEKPLGTKAAQLGFTPEAAAGAVVDPAYDGKSWREVEVKTPWGVKTRRYHVPLCVQSKAYEEAFDKWIRTRGNFSALDVKEQKALTEGSDADGGYFVPADYLNTLIQEETKNNAVRSLATVITTGRDIVRLNRYLDGTMAGYWVGEVEAATKGSFKLKQVSVEVNRQGAEVLISNDLLADSSTDVQGLVSSELAKIFSIQENAAFISGSGAGQPLGILTEVDGNGPASVDSGSNTALTADALIGLYGALDEQYERGSSWLMSKATLIAAEKLKDGNNRYIVSSMLNGSLQTPLVTTLKGFPINKDSAMPAIAQNAYPIIYGDISGYTIVDRVGVSIKFDVSNYISTNQTQVVGRKRVGGYTTHPFKMKVQKISA